MIIKKKSLAVALVSSFVISLVLILTLIGYAVYLEIKNENSISSYSSMLEKLKVKPHSR